MSNATKILIADDHPIFRKGLVDVIAPDGRFVIAGEAADGETALELTLKLRPRIALLDIDMPKLNGLEVLRQIRSNDEIRAIPVTILSNSMNTAEALEAYRLGANSFVRKPAGYKEIREFVQVYSKYWLEYSTLV